MLIYSPFLVNGPRSFDFSVPLKPPLSFLLSTPLAFHLTSQKLSKSIPFRFRKDPRPGKDDEEG